jgi:hypothetical protein
MLPADKPILLYREKLKEWEALGWRMDIDTIAATQGKTAYAIPSPQRRAQKGWVIDPIPLIKPISKVTKRAAG